MRATGINRWFSERDFDLTITAKYGPGPTNDMFVRAIALSGASVTAAGSNENATRESNEPDHVGNRETTSVWWKWTAPSSGRVTASTEGSSFDTLLAVYAGTSVSQRS